MDDGGDSELRVRHSQGHLELAGLSPEVSNSLSERGSLFIRDHERTHCRFERLHRLGICLRGIGVSAKDRGPGYCKVLAMATPRIDGTRQLGRGSWVESTLQPLARTADPPRRTSRDEKRLQAARIDLRVAGQHVVDNVEEQPVIPLHNDA